MNSTEHASLEGNTNLVTSDRLFEVESARFETSTWQQQMNSKDSLRTKPLGFPSILLERFAHNQNNSIYQKGTTSHITSERNNKASISDVWMGTRKVHRSPKDINFDKSVHRQLESLNSIIPTINNMYYQQIYDEECEGDTGRYKSAPRPIHRTQQEKDLLRQEEKMISAVEHEYDQATWRMYNRIMKHRQKRPLPDRYFAEVNKVVSACHDRMNTESNADTMPSDLTATTAGTSSSSSSPSLCDSPKFAPIQHSKSRSRIPKCVNYPDSSNDFHGGAGLPQSAGSNIMIDDANGLLAINLYDEEESDDEYRDMMMFDLEL